MKVAGLVLLNPDPNQVSADVVALGEPVKGLAGQKLLSDLALKLDAVRAVLGHGLPSFESPARRSILSRQLVRPKGPTPSGGHFFHAGSHADCLADESARDGRDVGDRSRSGIGFVLLA